MYYKNMDKSLLCIILASVLHTFTCSGIVKLPLTKSSHRQHLIEVQNTHTKHSPLRVKRAITEDGYNLHGMPGSGYYLEVAIGTPPQMVRVLVDTGSSNFAVATSPQPELNTYYQTNASSTYEYVGTEIYLPYTLGEWTGYLMRDVVSIPSLPGLNVTANIAGITESSNFFLNSSLWQGILGLGYAELARPDGSVSTFLESVFSQTELGHSFALQLCGTVDVRDNSTELRTAGTMTLGGVDESLYRGEIQYTPVYKKWYYEVVMTDIQIGGNTLDMPCKEYNFDKTIVDSGTTNFRLPAKVYEHFVREVNHKTMIFHDGWRYHPTPEFWSGEEMLCYALGAFPWDSFPVVTLSLAVSAHTVVDVDVTPRQYLMLTEPEDEAGEDGTYCYKFAVSSSDSGTVLGAVLMEGLYVVFDRENDRVGFAQSTCRSVDATVPQPAVSVPRKVHYNTTACAYVKVESDQTTLAIAMYIMIAVIVVCMLPLLVLFLQWQYHKHFKAKCFGHERTDQDNLLEAARTGSTASR